MEDGDRIKQRFELLKMAHELLNEDYINRRAEDHNKWVAENEDSWRTRRRNIPYPPFAQYPTDEEIVKAASNLYAFIYSTYTTECNTTEKSPAGDIAELVTHTSVSTDIKGTEPVEDVISQIVDEPKINLSIQSTEVLEPDPSLMDYTKIHLIEDIREPIIGDVAEINNQKSGPTTAVRRLLPGWVRRSLDTN